MSTPSFLVLLAAVLLIAGATARPVRQLQQNTVVNFVPTGAGCELKTSVTAEKSHSNSWFNNGPVITGQVTLLNPKEYGIPVSNVQVTAQSSDGQLYTAYADCGSGSPSTYVPTNPVPYTYGEAICTYHIQLDSRVFSSAAPTSSSTGSSSSGQPIQVGYFPSNNNNNNPYYYPSRPTWSVTAITTIGMTNAQCYSSPAVVDTSSWWSWFVNMFGSSSSSRGSSSSGGDFGSSSSGFGSTAPAGVGSAAVSESAQGGR
uniref:CUB domain-containing protein n=1 Tax=Tetradesmus obliquus TaxID=3088 RepID=A0A383VN52_TETOB|eukprot:jgi/Sobl393_1/1451/SZX66182.1